MLWCQGAQNIKLSNRKLKSSLLSAPYDHSARQAQTNRRTERRTDEHHGDRLTCIAR